MGRTGIMKGMTVAMNDFHTLLKGTATLSLQEIAVLGEHPKIPVAVENH